MAQRPLVVGETASPSGARQTRTGLHPVLDLRQQTKALVTEEQFAIPNASVHVDELSVREQLEHAIHAIRLLESTPEEIAEAAWNRQERHGVPDGGQRRSIQGPVATNANQEREARAIGRRPAAQAVEIGEDLEVRAMPAAPKHLVELEGRAEGATVPGARCHDDLDRAGPSCDFAS